MLDFLGLQKEANTLTQCLIAVGVMVGIMAAFYQMNGDKESRLGKVLYSLCMLGIFAAVIFGFLPGIALFFTFQWNIWIFGIIYAVIVALVIWGVAALIHYLSRRGKYARNPLMKKIVAYCKENGIEGVMCFNDRVRFYTDVEYLEYCESKRISQKASSLSNYYIEQQNFKLPELWEKMLRSPACCGELVFTELGYDKIPDLALFTTVLKSKLGWNRAEHYAEVTYYEEGKLVGNTKTNTNHICVVYNECFLFQKKHSANALQAEKQKVRDRQQAEREAEKARKERIKSGKTWE